MQRHTAPESRRAPVPPPPTPDPSFPGRDAALHDIANLLDASLRCAGAARRGSDPLKALVAVEAALVQMTDLLAALGPRRRALGAEDHAGSAFQTIHGVADLMRPLAAEHGVGIHAEASDALRGLNVPGLFRVLSELVRNSLESIGVARCAAGGPDGSILITGTVHRAASPASEGVLLIGVADDGIGLGADLPDPFVLGATSRSGSSGVGLAVARHIVQRLRGSITLASAGLTLPGRPGALVQIAVPLDMLRGAHPTP